MQLVRSDAHTHAGLAKVVAALLMVQVVVLGIATLLFFWREILPGRGLSDHSLVLVALVAGIAATFNPCAIPALPGFVAAAGAIGEEATARERLRLSAAASLGAAAVVAVFGLIVAVAGSSTGDIIEHNFRWVQLVAGILLISLAAIHLAGQTSRLPFVRTAMAVGNRIWEGVAGRRSTASSFGWGAGFIAIGAGWTAPFLAAVAVFAFSTGGYLRAVGAFLVSAATMAVLIFVMTFLGAAWGPAVARPLRIWGRRVQVMAALVIIVVGAALLYAAVNDHVWDRLILGA